MAANRSIAQFWPRFRAVNGTVTLYGTSLGLAYVFNIFVARWSGPMEYGRFLIVWNLITWTMTPASLGTSVAAVRFVPQYESTGDAARLGGFLIVSALATVAASIFLGVAGTAVSILNAFPALETLGCMLGPFWIVLITTNLGNLASEFARAGRNPWMAVGPQGVMRPAIALTLLAIGSVSGAPHTKVNAADILTALALSGILALLVQGGYLWRRFQESLGQRKIFEARRWLRASLKICLFSTAVGGLMQLDTLMAGILMGPIAAGVFGVDYRVGLVMEIPLAIANILVAPVLSSLFARREMVEMQTSTRRVSLLIFGSSIAMIMVIMVFASPILRMFGNQFIVGLTPLRWVAVGATASAAFGPVAFLVIITDLQSVGLMVLLFAGMIDVVVSVLLVPTLGLTGIAVAYVVSNVIRSVALYMVLKQRRGVTSGIFCRAVVV